LSARKPHGRDGREYTSHVLGPCSLERWGYIYIIPIHSFTKQSSIPPPATYTVGKNVTASHEWLQFAGGKTGDVAANGRGGECEGNMKR